MSRSQRTKGHNAERALAATLRDAFPAFADQIKRGWQTRLGCDDPDVCGLPGFWLESKVGARIAIHAALRQAKAGAKGRAMPMAVCRYDRGQSFCVIELSDMIRVLRAAYGFAPALLTVPAPEAAE